MASHELSHAIPHPMAFLNGFFLSGIMLELCWPEKHFRMFARQHQDARKKRKSCNHGKENPQCGNRAKRSRGRKIRKHEGEQTSHHRASRCHNWLPRAFQSRSHRLNRRALHHHFLAISRNHQQAIIGGSAHHENSENPLSLPIQAEHTSFCQVIHNKHCRTQSSHRRSEHGQWHQNRAIDDHEDHEYQPEGHEQKS